MSIKARLHGGGKFSWLSLERSSPGEPGQSGDPPPSHTAQSYKKEAGEEGVGVTSRNTVLVEELPVIVGAGVGEPQLSKF